MGAFTSEEKAKAALREAALRRYVYGKKVKAGTMNAKTAADGEAIMREIAADYMGTPGSSGMATAAKKPTDA